MSPCATQVRLRAGNLPSIQCAPLLIDSLRAGAATREETWQPTAQLSGDSGEHWTGASTAITSVAGKSTTLDRRHGGQGQGVRASGPARWATRSALAVVAVVTTGNLATRLAFSETAVRSRVARAMDQSSKLPSHDIEPLVGHSGAARPVAGSRRRAVGDGGPECVRTQRQPREIGDPPQCPCPLATRGWYCAGLVILHHDRHTGPGPPPATQPPGCLSLSG